MNGAVIYHRENFAFLIYFLALGRAPWSCGLKPQVLEQEVHCLNLGGGMNDFSIFQLSPKKKLYCLDSFSWCRESNRFDIEIEEATSRAIGRADRTSPVGGTWASPLNGYQSSWTLRDGEQNWNNVFLHKYSGCDWYTCKICN